MTPRLAALLMAAALLTTGCEDDSGGADDTTAADSTPPADTTGQTTTSPADTTTADTAATAPTDTVSTTPGDTVTDTTTSDTTTSDTTPVDTTSNDGGDGDSTFACGEQLACSTAQACSATGSVGCTGPSPNPDTGFCEPNCHTSRCGPAGPICLCTTYECTSLPAACEGCDCAMASAPDTDCTCRVTDSEVFFDCPNKTPLPSCDAIKSAYLALTSSGGRCGGADDCQVLNGHCGVGLGGCYYGVGPNTTQGDLDSQAATWVAAKCDEGAAVCDCDEPPTVRCDAGGCLLR